ncbi:hypothetical protein L1281_002572 [Neisseria sp. HSC-16F19]|nr:hypothetical protein [Neisseria sp. HSC-16F19]MCP2041954.1 hypothetical protein [Neisseria sp. HSC-16F19]
MNDAAVQAVHEDHNAERASKIGGVHNDVGDRLWGLRLLQAALFEAPLDGFDAALVLLRELRVSLFLVDVLMKQLIVIGPFGERKILVAVRTFISLPTVFTAVFGEGVFEAKRAFLMFIGKKSLKVPWLAAFSDFYHPKCPLVQNK